MQPSVAPKAFSMKRKILVVASAGGHWHQACQITEALPAEDLFFVTTMDELPQRDGKTPFAIVADRSEEHTSELQSLMRISYAVFCLIKKTHTFTPDTTSHIDVQLQHNDKQK